jgi:hypothetical protein
LFLSTGAWGMDFVSSSPLFSTTPLFYVDTEYTYYSWCMTSTDIVKWRKNEWLWKFWKRNDLYENFEKRGVVEKRGSNTPSANSISRSTNNHVIMKITVKKMFKPILWCDYWCVTNEIFDSKNCGHRIHVLFMMYDVYWYCQMKKKRMIMKILKKEWFIWKFWKKGGWCDYWCVTNV